MENHGNYSKNAFLEEFKLPCFPNHRRYGSNIVLRSSHILWTHFTGKTIFRCINYIFTQRQHVHCPLEMQNHAESLALLGTERAVVLRHHLLVGDAGKPHKRLITLLHHLVQGEGVAP